MYSTQYLINVHSHAWTHKLPIKSSHKDETHSELNDRQNSLRDQKSIVFAIVTTYATSTMSQSVNCRHLQMLLALITRATTSFLVPSSLDSPQLLCP